MSFLSIKPLVLSYSFILYIQKAEVSYQCHLAKTSGFLHLCFLSMKKYRFYQLLSLYFYPLSEIKFSTVFFIISVFNLPLAETGNASS